MGSTPSKKKRDSVASWDTSRQGWIPENKSIDENHSIPTTGHKQPVSVNRDHQDHHVIVQESFEASPFPEDPGMVERYERDHFLRQHKKVPLEMKVSIRKH